MGREKMPSKSKVFSLFLHLGVIRGVCCLVVVYVLSLPTDIVSLNKKFLKEVK